MNKAQALEQAKLACDTHVAQLNATDRKYPGDEGTRTWTTHAEGACFVPAVDDDPCWEVVFEAVPADADPERWIVHASVPGGRNDDTGFVIVEPGLVFPLSR